MGPVVLPISDNRCLYIWILNTDLKVGIHTNHPAFCFIIKQKYRISQHKIAKPHFFVLTCDAPCLYILNQNTPNQANLTHFSSNGSSAGL